MLQFFRILNYPRIALAILVNLIAMVVWAVFFTLWPSFDALWPAVMLLGCACVGWAMFPDPVPSDLRALRDIAVSLVLWGATLCAAYPLIDSGLRGVDIVGLIGLVVGVGRLPNTVALMVRHWGGGPRS